MTDIVFETEIVYRAAPGSRYSDAQAAIAGPEIRAIHERDGNATAETIVEAASTDASPIHSFFEWDDGVAGHRYRCEQARHLVRSIHIEYVRAEDTVNARAFFAVERRDGDAAGRDYTFVTEVKEDVTFASQVVDDFEREATSLASRYLTYREILVDAGYESFFAAFEATAD